MFVSYQDVGTRDCMIIDFNLLSIFNTALGQANGKAIVALTK